MAKVKVKEAAGIRRKTLLYFLLFSAIIVIVLWGLQLIFFNTFYKSMKRTEIRKSAEVIANNYGSSNFAESTGALANKNDMTVMVFRLEETKAVIEFHAGKMPTNNIEVLNELLYYLGNNSEVSYITQSSPGIESYTYGSILVDSATPTFLYVNASIEPLNNSTAVFMNQLLFITGICLLLGCVISFYLSKKIAVPIEQVTRSAKELAKGNLDVDFYAEGYLEIVELSNTLNYATSELRKTDQLRKDLISNVSHELRTPLTLIKAYAELIKDISGNNKEKREEHLNVILAEADRLKILVNDIMELSMLQSNTLTYEMKEFCLSSTSERVFNMFKGIYEAQGYEFINEISPDININADENRIEQVIFNLVANAVNYSGDVKSIKVSLVNSDNKITFTVSDKGMGVSEEEIPYIFDKFFKTEQSKRTKTGSGVGLSIVKSILDAHGYDYGVTSQLGEGSNFYFIITASK